MENSNFKNISSLLIATLFVSTSGVLGKYIDMPAETIAWFRAIIGAILIYGFCRFKKVDLKLKSKKDWLPFVLSALFMTGHWVAYIYALKLSNVAIGMLSLFTFPVMIAFLEPLFLKIKFNPIHLILGILVLIGLYILSPELTLESTELKGVIFGLLSALCYAIRILILKQHIGTYNGSMLMFYQMVIISVVLIPVLFIDGNLVNFESQFPYLFLIALLPTAIGHTMIVHSLRHFSASTASIISSIQPVFGIVLAFIFINEIPSVNTYVGGSFILLTVFIESFRNRNN
jgi:drug/metabolite transporter (DMT)-like permease